MKTLRGVLWLVMSLLLAAGCSTVDHQSRTHPHPSLLTDEHNWTIGHGELSSFIGDPEAERTLDIAEWAFLEGRDLAEQLGHEPFTGRWFLHNGAGKFGYGISSGTKNIGDEAYVSFIASIQPVQVERDVRIQLKQQMNRTDPAVLIKEEQVYVDTVEKEVRLFTFPLPDVENAAYALSAEILDETGNTEDTLISSFYVPRQEMNAGITIDQSTYASSASTATLTLSNAGPTTLYFGTDFSFEKLVDGQWRIVPLDLAFNSIGISLAPGNTYDQAFRLDELNTGHYRIVKRIGAVGSELKAHLAAQFTIE